MSAELLALIERFKDARVLVVGDAMIDHYHFGRVDRMCPEAPVPIFIEERDERRPGGAANVSAQLRALGCRVQESFPYRRSIKHRYVAGGKLLMRHDVDAQDDPTRADITTARIRSHFHNARAVVEPATAVVISDYAKGWCSEEMCRAVIHEAQQEGVPVVVDPKRPGWKKFSGATVLCPNMKEADEASDDALFEGNKLLITRGEGGASLHARTLMQQEWGNRLPLSWFPARAPKVVDVTGAGDTVTAVMAAALGSGGTLEQGAELAMLAAGWVVGVLGTAQCSAEKLKELVCK